MEKTSPVAEHDVRFSVAWNVLGCGQECQDSRSSLQFAGAESKLSCAFPGSVVCDHPNNTLQYSINIAE